MLVRILTENKNYGETLSLAGNYFAGYTVIKTTSIWDGEDEHGLIIEIDSIGQSYLQKHEFQNGIKDLCFDLKRLNKQDKILVQYIDCTSKLI